MLGLAVLPSISHALMARKSSAFASNPWAELCSTGSTTAASGERTDLSRQSRTAAKHLADCGECCLMAAASVGMPPAPAAVAAVPERVAYVAPLFRHAPRPLFAWAAAQARAPPSFI